MGMVGNAHKGVATFRLTCCSYLGPAAVHAATPLLPLPTHHVDTPVALVAPPLHRRCVACHSPHPHPQHLVGSTLEAPKPPNSRMCLPSF